MIDREKFTLGNNWKTANPRFDQAGLQLLIRQAYHQFEASLTKTGYTSISQDDANFTLIDHEQAYKACLVMNADNQIFLEN